MKTKPAFCLSVLLCFAFMDAHSNIQRLDMPVSTRKIDTIRVDGFYENIVVALLLSKLQGSKTARDKIHELAVSSNVFIIGLTSGASGTTPTSALKAYRNEYILRRMILPDDSIWEGGAGANILINIGQRVFEEGSDDPKACAECNLAHELLGHGFAANNGAENDTKVRSTVVGEFQACHAENQIRSELGIPLRTFFGVEELYCFDDGTSTFLGFIPLVRGAKSAYYEDYDYSIQNPPSIGK